MKITTEEFINKAKLVHGDKYDYSKVEYISSHKKVCIICPEHGEFLQTPHNHCSSKQGCNICGKRIKIIKTSIGRYKFIWKSIQKHGYKYDYRKVNYVNNLTKVCIICPEHGEFLQAPSKHLIGQGCHLCANNDKSSTNSFMEKAKLVHDNKYDYSKVEYVNALTKVCIICPKHGEYWQKPNDHLRNHGCPICNESKLEIEIAKLLDENNITYERQKRFKWLGRQSLDFYLPDYNVAIECQGEQHFEKHSFYDNLNKIIELDNKKYRLCSNNFINVLYYCKYQNFIKDYIGKLYFNNEILNDELFGSSFKLYNI